MDSQLETLGLLAALLNAPLRKELSGLDLSDDAKRVSDALLAPKEAESLKVVSNWLRERGIRWDGKQKVADAIIESLKRHSLKGEFHRQFKRLQLLSASANWLPDEKLSRGIEIMKGFVDECSGDNREPHARPTTEAHTERSGGD